MAEFDSAERLEEEKLSGFVTDVMTGDKDKRMYLYYQLINSLKKADSVDIIVSFLIEFGVKKLETVFLDRNKLEGFCFRYDLSKIPCNFG